MVVRCSSFDFGISDPLSPNKAREPMTSIQSIFHEQRDAVMQAVLLHTSTPYCANHSVKSTYSKIPSSTTSYQICNHVPHTKLLPQSPPSNPHPPLHYHTLRSKDSYRASPRNGTESQQSRRSATSLLLCSPFSIITQTSTIHQIS